MCRVGMLVLLPVGRVPVYCRVGQRSAVLWRQIAVGCWSTDHSDPKQFCGVLQGDKHRFILSQQEKGQQVKVQCCAARYESIWVVINSSLHTMSCFLFLVSRRVGSLSTLDMSTTSQQHTAWARGSHRESYGLAVNMTALYLRMKLERGWMRV